MSMTPSSPFSFPGGKLRHVALAATAGNVVLDTAVPSGKRWWLLYGQITIVCDAIVDNRYVRLSLTDGTNEIHRFARNSTAITASQTQIVTYGMYDGAETPGGLACIPIPSVCVIKASDEIRVTITDGAAGDSYSGTMTVLEVEAS